MTAAGEFRRRAGFEARRYGSDAWVFVRELIQNSRDAGASRIEIICRRDDGVDRILCRDDGCGMTFDHARKYLFTLYASSKHGTGATRDTAGRFGIGFWSVLRFAPERIIVRSAPSGGSPWQARLSGDLERVEVSVPSLDRGTEVELQRPAGSDDLEQQLWRVVRRDARYLRRRGTDDEAVDVLVNSRSATSELELPPPSLVFRAAGLRGVAALGDAPRVDLLAHGLRVRTTSTLDELVADQAAGRARPGPTLPEGLVPQLVLDSRRLRVLMARADASSDRELHRLVRLGRGGLRRLVRSELDRQAGLGRLGRIAMRVREAMPFPRLAAALAMSAAAALIAFGVVEIADSVGRRGGGSTVAPGGLAIPADLRPETVLAGDLAGRYRGPVAGANAGSMGEVALRYRPAAAGPMLAVFRVSSVGDDGRVPEVPEPDPGSVYDGVECGSRCLELELDLATGPGPVRLPVPTGHRLDAGSLTIGRGAATLRAAADGGPVLVFATGYRGPVRYRTGAAADLGPRSTGPWPSLPPDAAAFADGLRALDVDDAVRGASEWVRRRVAYDASPAVAARYRDAGVSDLGFVARCLAIGAGDCDVQSVVASAVLARAGVPVRVAVGWVGRDGRAVPGLHAWVEVRTPSGLWRVEDVSSVVAGGGVVDDEPSPPGVAVIGAEAPDRAAVDRGSGTTVALGWALVFGVAALSAAAAVGLRSRSASRRHRPGDRRHLAGLVRGALTRPEAYAEVPAVFDRPMVPTRTGRPLSLRRARRLADRGLLAVSCDDRGSDVEVASGCAVLDGRAPEGAVASAVLGAVDLDRWRRLLEHGRCPAWARAVERAAAAAGERWRVRVVQDGSGDVAVLDGRFFGFRRRTAVIAVSDGGRTWQAVRGRAVQRPRSAALLLAHTVFEAMGRAGWRRRRTLLRLARGAVIEAPGADS